MASKQSRVGKDGKTYWRILWRSPDKKQRALNLGPISKAEAEVARKEKENELRRERNRKVLGLRGYVDLVFESVAEDYLDWHEQENTDNTNERIRSMFKTHFNPFFGATPISDISRQMGERYKTMRLESEKERRDGTIVSPSIETIRKEIIQLKAFLNWCVEQEHIQRHSLAGLKPPKNRESKPHLFFSDEQLALIYANSEPLSGDEARRKLGGRPPNSSIKDYAPIWKLFVNTGMRRAEAYHLEWENVNFPKRVIEVLSREKEEETTKSAKWRVIPINDETLLALQDLHRITGKKKKVLPRVKPSTYSNAFKRILERLNLPGSLHTTRHTFCSHLVMNGVDLYTVKELAGHASMNTTQRYAHLNPKHLHDAVNKINL